MSAQSQSHTVQQLQIQLKNVLAANHGTVKLSDLPAAWLAVHRTPLHYATYGARSIVDLLDKCRIVCRYNEIEVYLSDKYKRVITMPYTGLNESGVLSSSD